MKKITQITITTIIFLCIAAQGIALAAGSCTITTIPSSIHDRGFVVTWAWTSGAGTVDDDSCRFASGNLNHYVTRCYGIPSATNPPDPFYDVTILDSNGSDISGEAYYNLSATVTDPSALPQNNGISTNVQAISVLEFTAANTGNATQGQFICVLSP